MVSIITQGMFSLSPHDLSIGLSQLVSCSAYLPVYKTCRDIPRISSQGHVHSEVIHFVSL